MSLNAGARSMKVSHAAAACLLAVAAAAVGATWSEFLEFCRHKRIYDTFVMLQLICEESEHTVFNTKPKHCQPNSACRASCAGCLVCLSSLVGLFV